MGRVRQVSLDPRRTKRVFECLYYDGKDICMGCREMACSTLSHLRGHRNMPWERRSADTIYHWLKKHTFLSGATPGATAETTKSEIMKILIVSVNAGGGHTTAMHSLLLSLQRFAPYVSVEHYISPNRVLEHIHRLAYTKGPYLYNAFYKATAYSTTLRKAYFGVTYASIRSLCSELAPLLGEYDV